MHYGWGKVDKSACRVYYFIRMLGSPLFMVIVFAAAQVGLPTAQGKKPSCIRESLRSCKRYHPVVVVREMSCLLSSNQDQQGFKI